MEKKLGCLTCGKDYLGQGTKILIEQRKGQGFGSSSWLEYLLCADCTELNIDVTLMPLDQALRKFLVDRIKRDA